MPSMRFTQLAGAWNSVLVHVQVYADWVLSTSDSAKERVLWKCPTRARPAIGGRSWSSCLT